MRLRTLVRFTVGMRKGNSGSWVFWFGVCSFYQNVASDITLKPHFLCPAVVKRSEMPVIRSSIYIRLNKATAKCKL